MGDRPLRVRSSQVRHLRGLRVARDGRADAPSLGLQEEERRPAQDHDSALVFCSGKQKDSMTRHFFRLLFNKTFPEIDHFKHPKKSSRGGLVV